jgi:hypothetical protein
MLLQSALTDLWLARGELARAREEGEAFLAVACATAERTWQAMAWEANARIALESPDVEHARRCISNALSAMDGFEVPLAAWRVHATAAELSERLGDMGAAEHHRELGRDTILTLATSLPPEHPLRRTFLSTPSVSKLLAGSGIPAQVPHTP